MDRAASRRLPEPTGKLRAALIARLCRAVKVVTAYQQREMACPAAVPDVPGPVAHVWEWFWRIERTRQGGFGPQAITCQEIMAWSEGRFVVRPWEMDALLELDGARREAMTPPSKGEETGLRRSVAADDAARALAMFDRFGRVER